MLRAFEYKNGFFAMSAVVLAVVLVACFVTLACFVPTRAFAFERGSLVLGDECVAYIAKDGSLYTWDEVRGYKEDRTKPVKVLSGVVQAAADGINYAAVTKDGSLYLWERDSYDWLGDGSNPKRSTKPAKVRGLSNVIQASLGDSHFAAVTSNGSLYMWGTNSYGQLGDGTNTNRTSPVKVLSNVAKVSLGSSFSAAITKDGSLYTWGANYSGQLGHGSTASAVVPTKVAGLQNVTQVSLGTAHAAAVTADGALYLWGAGGDGQLGDGLAADCLSPKKIMSSVSWIALAGDSSAAVTRGGSLYMWGQNYSGQLGNGTTSDRLTPGKVLSGVAEVVLSGTKSAAIAKDGSLYRWGEKAFVFLGKDKDGSIGFYSSRYEKTLKPEKVSGLTTVITSKTINTTRSTKARTFKLKAKANSQAVLKYSSSSKKITVDKYGRVKVPKKFVGKAKITITAPATGDFLKAKKIVTVSVNPKRVSLKKLTSPKKGWAKMSWKKVAAATSYQFRISKVTDVILADPNKLSIAKTTITINKLKSKKTYYVQVRACQKVGKKTYYGAWSNVKAVKVK